jgi:RHH-type proline utilization regulon transcriptional repressor/proline dehydrogenase/delta 1-pyrroline-5-carboxylate dehydrogenase
MAEGYYARLMKAVPDAPFVFAQPPPVREGLRAAIAASWLADESAIVRRLVADAELPGKRAAAVVATAAGWVRRVRALRDKESPLDAFMREYDLSSEEGVLLMCLAEALLRIPDDATAEKLIADKLADADWDAHLGKSDSLFVNASTWGLMLTGRIVRLSPSTTGNFRKAIDKLVGKSSEPVIRLAIRQAMRLMGHQFVMGRTIEEAMGNARSKDQKRYLHSYDMLGEAALTAADAQRYLASYHAAIKAIGGWKHVPHGAPVMQRPGISVKLSALHPRYEFAKADRVRAELTPVLVELARAARRENINLTVDAEEADRLELSLDLFEAAYRDDSLSGWDGFGLAVQAFQKRAVPVLEWLEHLGRAVGRRIPVRLVKGAYWDTEVKRAQEQGLASYPVFTRKLSTDVSYLACARRLLVARDVFYPQFATHNAHTAAAIREHAGDGQGPEGLDGYEFQRLHGMGEALYEVVGQDLPALPCRVYAPVGSHEDLLPYLVRRLLENGANTSFVNRIFDDAEAPEQLVADPVAAAKALSPIPNPGIATPAALYGSARRNSAGLNLADEAEMKAFAEQLQKAAAGAPSGATVTAQSLVAAKAAPARKPGKPITDPADRRRVVGAWQPLDPAQVPAVVDAAVGAFARWSATPAELRAAALERAADALEARRAEFVHLLIREAGKTLPDSNSELREAVDFLRYYAAQARALAEPVTLPGPTGEHNELQLHGRGVFVCISPWNFPLAIFAGQVAAALVTGNTVIAKPAEQTNLVAVRMVQVLREAGIPDDVLQCALGEGDVGGALTADPRIAGVAFTGSVEVARLINRALAARDGSIATLIAETGGQNAMIVDSSALPEQVVKDTIASAFNAAGQRCSALRVLFLQDEIADKVIAMLKGAMAELVIGDPGVLSTDVGPVIDAEAQQRLEKHAAAIRRTGTLIDQRPLPDACKHGTYFAPCAVEIGALSELKSENFGAMLHVIRYRAKDLEKVVEQINASGFGLTLGVHSRIESTWRRVQAVARVGNTYINRNMIGAVVGVQPFGGEGLSGTGPKAGGPHYLLRFVTERTLTINTAAVGGNARLLASS